MNFNEFEKLLEELSEEDTDAIFATMKERFEERYPHLDFYAWLDSQMPEDC